MPVLELAARSRADHAPGVQELARGGGNGLVSEGLSVGMSARGTRLLFCGYLKPKVRLWCAVSRFGRRQRYPFLEAVGAGGSEQAMWRGFVHKVEGSQRIQFVQRITEQAKECSFFGKRSVERHSFVENIAF